MRFERKYRIVGVDPDRVANQLIMHSAGFRLQYPDRQVNSIYYDDLLFSNVQANLSGVANRSKFRIRWYGENESEMSKPILEQKVKRGELGRKECHPLPDFSFAKQLLISGNLPSQMQDLIPLVSVHYTRSYYISFDQNVRATIDRDVRYKAVQNDSLSTHAVIDPPVILEVKYDTSHSTLGDQVSAELPFRIGKNSKYVSAVQQLWF